MQQQALTGITRLNLYSTRMHAALYPQPTVRKVQYTAHSLQTAAYNLQFIVDDD